MPKINRPKLVNRGPAGLITKLKTHNGEAATQEKVVEGKVNNIAPPLKGMIVDIDSLTPDPVNARLHPERNMEAIRLSLKLYGQVKPLVVQKSTRIVVAGNGTLQAAQDLGWTQIAAAIIEMDDLTAQGYGLADNRTAELARWDFEVVARLERLQREAGLDIIGWSQDELEVLRAADWTPPPEEEWEGEDTIPVVKLTAEQRQLFEQVCAHLRDSPGQEGYGEGECLTVLCQEYLSRREKPRAKTTGKK